MFAQFFSLQMDQRAEKSRNKARTIALSHESALLDAAGSAQSMSDLVQDIAQPFCDLLEADGLAVITSQGIAAHGAAPDVEAIGTLADTVFAQAGDDLIIYDTLVDFDVSCETGAASGPGARSPVSAGLLAFRLGDDPKSGVIFFRKEASTDLTWAGVPDKEIVATQDGLRLKPRASFSAYKQSVKGKCHPWEPHTLASANEVRLALAKADASLFRRLSQKEERQRSIYIAELNHRVRNILALVRSLSRRSRDSSTSIEAYAQALEQRITALGAAHDLATNRLTSGLNISTMIETEAKPYIGRTKNELFITGESHIIKPDVAPIFALIIHELMTNCVKYGAFSNDVGCVHVNIDAADGEVQIHWRESGGPKIKAPSKQGFGLGFVKEAIPYELDGSSTVHFLPDGLNVALSLPAGVIVSQAESVSQPNQKQTSVVATKMPSRVLVVEDSMMVALDTCDMLRRMGVETIETSASVNKAQSAIARMRPDFAILDVSLRDTNSFAVAVTLQSLGTPFCFVTGYGSDIDLPENLKGETLLTKPIETNELRETIEALYQRQ